MTRADEESDAIIAAQDLVLGRLRDRLIAASDEFAKLTALNVSAAAGIEDASAQLSALRAALEAGGVILPESPNSGQPKAELAVPALHPHQAAAHPSFEEVLAQARAELAALGLTERDDPLLAVIDTSVAESAMRRFDAEYGSTAWDEADWVMVIAAGIVGGLVDMDIVGLPRDMAYLGAKRHGAKLTATLRDSALAKRVQGDVLDQLSDIAHVPFDQSITLADGSAPGALSPWTHRLHTPGHDFPVGLLVGTWDIWRRSGTYVVDGEIARRVGGDQHGLIASFAIEVAHLLSDAGTSQGLPAPFLFVTQMVDLQSPFRLVEGKGLATWPEVGDWMYRRGYDLRHFFASGAAPGAVAATIRAYAHLRELGSGEPVPEAKVASMLVVGHALAWSGMAVKVVVEDGNPTAVNWATVLASIPVLVHWVRALGQRDTEIQRDLDAGWAQLVATSAMLPG